ncbi:MAG: hypothetical protein ACRDHK_03590, partial [Actinomycetota bacterium]
MPRPGKKSERNRRHRQKARERFRRRMLKSPCDRPPVAPTGLVGVFDREERRRHDRLRTRLRWTEVNKDTSGFTITLQRYSVEFQKSDDGVIWTTDPHRYR